MQINEHDIAQALRDALSASVPDEVFDFDESAPAAWSAAIMEAADRVADVLARTSTTFNRELFLGIAYGH